MEPEEEGPPPPNGWDSSPHKRMGRSTSARSLLQQKSIPSRIKKSFDGMMAKNASELIEHHPVISLEQRSSPNLVESYQFPPPPSVETKSKRLRRSISGKLRSSTNKIDSITHPPPSPGDSLHKLIRQGVSSKQFAKLVKRTQFVDQLDSNGQSALHLCISRGLIDHSKLLLRRGSNINLQDNTGFTPLHCGALEQQIESCKFLLECKGINATITTNENANVLHYLVRNFVDEENVVVYRRVLDLLIEKGLDVNVANRHSEAPIHYSCMKGNILTAAFLLERGADCNLKTAVGETPLHYAIRSGCLKLVRMLMENGADPTAVGEDNATPFDIAEQYQNIDILDCLQAIIAEELEEFPTLLSPRVRINESNVMMEGWVEALEDELWQQCYLVVNPQRIICYKDYRKKVKYSINLTNTTLAVVAKSVMSDFGEQLWGWTLCHKGSEYYFAANSPELRERWTQSVERVLQNRRSLCVLNDKLKALSSPREKLRLQEREIDGRFLKEGLAQFKEIKLPANFFQWVLNDLNVSAVVLCELVDIEDETIISTLVRYFTHHGVFVEFMNACISHDIRKTAIGETLFREMSLATRMLSSYMDMEEGRRYLKNTISTVIAAIAAIDQSLEVNPSSMAPGEANKVRANMEQLLAFSQDLLDRVLSSANVCPLLFRQVMGHTREKVDDVFPNMTHAVVGGFVFLRFLCPAIIAPDQYGLIPKKPNLHASRAFVLITKILQSVSNGVEYDGSKEDYMQRLNPFIKRNRLYVNVFFDNLTDRLSIEKQCAAHQSARKVNEAEEEIKQFEQIIYNHVSKRKDIANCCDTVQ